MRINFRSLHRIGLILAGSLVLSGVATHLPQSAGPPDRGVLALIGATVIDGTGGPPIPDAVVIVEGDRIVAVGPRARVSVPPGALRREIAGLTVLPGLIDSHVHLGLALPPGLDPTQADTIVTPLLSEFLRSGVTSIRDLGDAYPWIVELARSVNSGRRAGPRIFTAGPIITAPGGHPAGTLLKGNDAVIKLATRQVAKLDEGRAAVRELASGGVDIIKVVFDSGRPDSRFGLVPKLDAEVLQAIIADASAANLPVTAHWGNTSELPILISARPAQIEHGGRMPIPDSVIKEIAGARIAIDPTLAVLSSALPSAEFSSGPLENVRKLARAGAAITAGTDAPLGGLRFGDSLHRELELLVEAGLSPMEAVQAATIRPARILRRADLGTIEPRMRADLIVVAGNPLLSISDTRNVRMVLRDGKVFDYLDGKGLK